MPQDNFNTMLMKACEAGNREVVLMEAAPVDAYHYPRVWEEQVRLLEGLDVFISAFGIRRRTEEREFRFGILTLNLPFFGEGGGVIDSPLYS